MQTFNYDLFLLINASPDAASWLINLNIFVAKRVIYIIPILLAITWILGQHKQRKTALHAFFLVVVGLFINQVIGMFVPTDRPFMVGVGSVLLSHAPTPSFPSNHLTIFMCVALAYYYGGLRNIAYVLTVIGLFVAWSRIYVGVHFPIDMMGAILISIITFVLTIAIWRKTSEGLTTILENIYTSIIRLGR